MRFSSLFVVVISLALISVNCNNEFYPVGDVMLSDLTLFTKKEVAPAFTFQEKLEKVQTNGLPLVQLGTINHPFFGKAEATPRSFRKIYSKKQSTSSCERST